MINPWLALAALVLLGGVYAYGRHDGKQLEIASQAASVEAIAKARDAMAEAAAKAIAGIEVKHVTVRQTLETQLRENTVFRDGKCDFDDRTISLLNRALAGYPAEDGGVSEGIRPPTGQVPGNGSPEARGSPGNLF